MTSRLGKGKQPNVFLRCVNSPFKRKCWANSGGPLLFYLLCGVGSVRLENNPPPDPHRTWSDSGAPSTDSSSLLSARAPGAAHQPAISSQLFKYILGLVTTPVLWIRIRKRSILKGTVPRDFFQCYGSGSGIRIRDPGLNPGSGIRIQDEKPGS